jgi:membrane protein
MQTAIDPAHDERSRGRYATDPTEIPARGWKDILTRARVEAKEDHASLLAAGVAFYALLALVPALIALITMYSVAADPATIEEQITDALAAAPNEVRDLVATQLQSIQESSAGTATFALLFGIIVALWSASSGVQHLVEAINLAYDERETRGFVRKKALALALTLGAVVFVLVSFGVIAVFPVLLEETGVGAAARWGVEIVRWAVLFGAVLVALAVLYRYAPDRDDPQWSWVSLGAVCAAVLWLAASILFSVYTANFAKYNDTYGSLGAVVVLMLWLYLTALAVILGAEVNAEMERQTVHDTTEGTPAPMGRRRAYAADTLGETAEQATQAEDRPTTPR